MDDALACRLAELNRRFYDENAASFSGTRRSPWPGWERCAAAAEERISGDGRPGAGGIRVLDLACGNMRFERYLTERFPGRAFEATAVDSCDGLAAAGDGLPAGVTAEYRKADIVGALLAGTGLPAVPGEMTFDLAVCFGFAHHVPGAGFRRELVAGMCRYLAPGAVGAVSLWRFAADDAMREKAERSTAEARGALGLPPLDEGDYILGWDRRPGAWRYCHSFPDAEVDGLASSLPEGFELVDRFESDGRTGALNAYLVFRRVAGGCK